MYRKIFWFITYSMLFIPVSLAQDAKSLCKEEADKVAAANTKAENCKNNTTITDEEKASCKVASEETLQAREKLKVCSSTIPASKADTDAINSQYDKIQEALEKQKDSDFELELGIGSLLRNGDITDYNNNANTLSATSLGSATPQYLLGVAMRSEIPNFKGAGPNKAACAAADRLTKAEDFTQATKDTDKALAALCPSWRRKPFAGFLSLKFSPNSTQTISGYVLGASYRAMHYMNILIGFSLTPINEPSYGLRTAAAQYVTAQQKLGNLLNFNPAAMQANLYNAFDGFSLLDGITGKLIYNGTPIEIHYRGGVTIGVSIPINFADFLKNK